MDSTTSILWLMAGAPLLAVVGRAAVPPAAWIALPCLLHASRSMPPARGAVLVWMALFAAFSIIRRAIMPVGGPAVFAVLAMDAAATSIPFLIDRLVAVRVGGVVSTLVFPLAYTAMELLRSRLTPSATWGSIAYSQYGLLPLMQVASVAGLSGITFLVAWFGSTAEFAWARAFDWHAIRVPASTFAAICALAIAAGSLRVMLAPTDGPSLRVATLNRPMDLFVPGEITRIIEGRVTAGDRPYFDEKLSRLHQWFLDGVRREARAGARVVTWPEQALLVFEDGEPAFLERARHVAREERVFVAMGIGAIHLGAPRPFENKVVIVDADGTVAGTYLKVHPVMGWEAGIMRQGTGPLPVFPTSHGRVGTAICFDGDFPEFVSGASRAAADLLVVPANDWLSIKTLHQQMAAFRAVENGIPLVRPAASGISSAIDPWGRVLATSDDFAHGDRTMTAQVPVGRVRTAYALVGDLFGWLCVAGTLASILAAFRAG